MASFRRAPYLSVGLALLFIGVDISLADESTFVQRLFRIPKDTSSAETAQQSLQMLDELLVEAKKELRPDSFLIGDIFAAQATMQGFKPNPDLQKSRLAAAEAEAIFRKALKQDSETLADRLKPFALLAQTVYRDFPDAERRYAECFALADSGQVLGMIYPHNNALAEYKAGIGEAQFSQGKYKEAEDSFIRSVQYYMAGSYPGMQTNWYSFSTFRLSILYDLLGKPADEEYLYQHALERVLAKDSGSGWFIKMLDRYEAFLLRQKRPVQAASVQAHRMSYLAEFNRRKGKL